jgi:TubC N-terminal docking domain
MTATSLITRCRELGITLACGPEGKLRVHPASLLSDDLREALQQQKAEVLALLSRPYLNAQGELIIPCESDPKYHYWKPGGQSLAVTLLELKASAEVWQRYIGAYTETLQ